MTCTTASYQGVIKAPAASLLRTSETHPSETQTNALHQFFRPSHTQPSPPPPALRRAPISLGSALPQCFWRSSDHQLRGRGGLLPRRSMSDFLSYLFLYLRNTGL